MIEITATKQFERDWKKHSKLAWSAEWREVMECLQDGKTMLEARKDHPLKGEWKGCRDCHIKPDVVLIYEYRANKIILHRIGSHSELDL